MKVFITSDNHFFHKNIIKYCHRPFKTVEEMNEYMIKRWNKIVTDDDLVFHLGDFALTNKTNLEKIRKRLKGRIIIILGNHDRKRKLNQPGFIIHKTDRIEMKNIVLSHRPLDKVDERFVNVHGHIHDKKTRGRRINASVDLTNFEPQPIEKYFKEATRLLKE